MRKKRPPPLNRWPAALDHVFGDRRLSDLEPELDQFAMDARRSPDRIFHAHLLDQRTKVGVDPGPPSPGTGLPMPIAAKARPMPTHQRLGMDDRKSLQNRRKQSGQVHQKPAVAVGEPGPTWHLTAQNDQLMSEYHVLCFKPTPRLEWRGQSRKEEAEQCQHAARTSGDSFSRTNTNEVFGTHSMGVHYSKATLLQYSRCSNNPGRLQNQWK